MEEEVNLRCRFLARPLNKVLWYRGQRLAEQKAVHTTNDEVSEGVCVFVCEKQFVGGRAKGEGVERV